MNIRIATDSKILVVKLSDLTDDHIFLVGYETERGFKLIERANEELVVDVVSMHIPALANEVTISADGLRVIVENIRPYTDDCIRFAIMTELKKDMIRSNDSWERGEILRIMGEI